MLDGNRPEPPKYTTGEELILRGLHLLIRISFMPNDERRRLAHLEGLQKDIGPWLADYATAIGAPPPPQS